MADTAELAVYLKLYADAYNRGLKSAEANTASFGRTASAIGGHIKSGLGSALTNLTRIGLVAGAAVGVGLAAQVRAGFDSLTRLEEVTAQTNAVLRSTKGAAGESAKAIIDLSNKYEDLNATIDNKVIQSAENLLLTFTSIRKNAFEPALKAALDMNQAMGGGEGGLQGTIIQVGKALQDPILGLTALRRVGVNFTLEQQKQIKTLIAHNKLYAAQKLILAELTKEFGGSFAAAGKTATGTFATLGDAIEDIQMNLTRALLPALTDVAKELTKVAKDPAFLKGVEDFGKGLAGAFRNAVTFAKQVPWKAIGDGLKTAAGFAGELVKRFAEAPDWLKTAVITGWGLNKLTGGALTGIVGDVAKGIGGQFLSRGASPANPLWVKDVGGGIPGVAGAAGVPLSAVAGTIAIIASPLIIRGIVSAMNPTNAKNSPWGYDPSNGNWGAVNGPGGGLSAPTGSRTPPMPGYGQFMPGTGIRPEGGGPLGGGAASRGGFISHAVQANITALRANTIALKANARDIEKAWLKTIDPEDIAARSKAKTGRDASPAQIAATRTRDELHQLKVITEKSQARSETKLERLRVLAQDAKAHGDTATAKKIQAAIDKMKADIKAAQSKTTSAVTTASGAIVGAIAGSKPNVNVFVTTNVTANSVTRATTSVARYGNTGGDRRYDP